MTIERDTIDGYVADSLYPSSFHQVFSPPWTDTILRHRGIRPPRSARAPFTLVDLGCGDGVGLLALAAAHPEARFIGLDAMPGHIARGQAIAAEIGLSNVELHCATFAQGQSLLDAGLADYVACQGVLAWVSPENRDALLDLAAHVLKPGGALTIGYNCFPGWAQIAAFQRAIRAMATDLSGTPTERFDQALSRLRESGGIAKAVWEWFDPLQEKLPRDYFAHEYLNAHWNPLWAEDAVSACAARGMILAGEARPWRLRPDLCLQRKWREALATIADPAPQQSAMDVFTHNWFRTDIYVRETVPALSDEEAEAARMANWWMSTLPANEMEFEGRTAAGTIRFDNAAARAIMALLEDGPAPLSAVGGIAPADLLNTIDALFITGAVHPADPPIDVPLARAANRLLRGLDAGGAAMNGLAGRHGAVGVTRGTISALSPGDRTRLGIED